MVARARRFRQSSAHFSARDNPQNYSKVGEMSPLMLYDLMVPISAQRSVLANLYDDLSIVLPSWLSLSIL